jgi:glycosyltransferase involved in cell wall biosynthesis
MKVLHIAAGNLFGGIETMLIALARERSLAPAMEPHFAVCFDGALSRQLRALGAITHSMGEVRTRLPWTVWRARQNLRSLLKKERYDVVVCHASWCQAIFAPVVQELRIPQIFWLHDVPARYHWLDRWTSLSPPDLAICNSQFTASTLPRLFPHAKSVVIHSPVSRRPAADLATRLQLRAGLGIDPETVAIMSVGRMQEGKGHPTLLRALAKLDSPANWHCWIVGGPQRRLEETYFRSLSRQVTDLSLGSRVTLLGQREDVPVLMQAADIYCQPNTAPDSFGITFVEALYAGLPIVTTGFGGVTEFVDSACGRLVPPGNLNALSAALASLLSDSGMRLQLGAAGRDRAHNLCDPTVQMMKISTAVAGLSRAMI